MKYYVRLIRPKTGSLLTIRSPLDFDIMDEHVAAHLTGWADYHYPGFEICDFWTEDQKLMFETA